jgi:hypothetical protein
VNLVKAITVAALMTSFVGLQPVTTLAQGRDRRDRYEDQRERREDRRYRARRLNRNDYVYRGSDNRYYCRRDDGTTGLIVGGIAGGVLGQIIAPGGAKTLGAIIGAGAGALIGRAIDDGDVVCR